MLRESPGGVVEKRETGEKALLKKPGGRKIRGQARGKAPRSQSPFLLRSRFWCGFLCF